MRYILALFKIEDDDPALQDAIAEHEAARKVSDQEVRTLIKTISEVNSLVRKHDGQP